MLGTRGGGSIAGAWATLVHLGEDGFLRTTRKIMNTRKYIMDAIRGDELSADLFILGEPHSTILSFGARGALSILAVADVMEDDHGWKIERQQKPDCVHLTLMPQHERTKEKFVEDLVTSVRKAKEHHELAKAGTAAMYGMVASIPSAAVVEQFMAAFLARVYSPAKEDGKDEA
jgi:sphinganine-1-phosphate aldolase